MGGALTREELGAVIRHARRRLGLSQTEAMTKDNGCLLKVSQTLSRIEGGLIPIKPDVALHLERKLRIHDLVDIVALCEAARSDGLRWTPDPDEDPWRHRRLEKTYDLTGARPVYTEIRTVEPVLRSSRIFKISARYGKPPVPLQVTALWGARLLEERRPTDDRWLWRWELPLRAAPTREFALRKEMSETSLRPGAHFLVQTPRHDLGELRYRVRFNPNHMPGRVWRIDGWERWAIHNTPVSHDDDITPDEIHEIIEDFCNLRAPLAYGIGYEYQPRAPIFAGASGGRGDSPAG